MEQREIKFRAWDGFKMYEPCVWMGKEYQPSRDSFIETHLMQYTCLKDKNGKEIYEGDIVRVKECECVGQSADGSEEEWIECEGEVSFEDGMFVFDGHSAGTLPISAYKDSFEVIGNIYEK